MTRKITNYFDKIYVINLLSRPDRRKFMTEQLSNNGFLGDVTSQDKFEFVDAVKIPGFNDNVTKAFNEENQSEFNTGLFFCTMEHYRILKRALYYGYDRVLILEDDACFLKDSEKVFDALDKVPSDAHLIHLEGFYWPDQYKPTEADWLSILVDNPENGVWFPVGDFRLWASAAIGYDRTGMENIVKRQENHFQAVDFQTFVEDDGVYFYTYPLVVQENKGTLISDINNYANTADSRNVYLRKVNRDNYYSISDF